MDATNACDACHPVCCLCVCAQDISAGAALVRVPLRLAITDVMEEEEQQRVVGQVGGTGQMC
jgi:hypothetical protein